MFVEFHILQSFPPSNLNRDDTNNPKEALFGGVRRARISSQSFKRAIRKAGVFKDTVRVPLAHRTRYIKRLLLPKLEALGKSGEDAHIVLGFVIPLLFSDLDSEHPERTKVLIYISEPELDAVAQGIVEQWETLLPGAKEQAKHAGKKGKKEQDESPEVKQAKEAVRKKIAKAIEKYRSVTPAPDIALFGRMLAESPEQNLDAASQVAHALSTHRVTMETDFYTAVDDITQNDEPGAGMMGYIPYDSATFYRYLRVDWKQLVENLGDDKELARRTVEGFIRAMVEAVPSGKQNAFAAYTPPSLLFGVVREGGFAWSLVNAFERPVQPDRMEGGYMRPSIEALDRYWGRLAGVYGEKSVKARAVLPLEADAPLEALKDAVVDNMESFIETIMGALPGEEA